MKKMLNGKEIKIEVSGLVGEYIAHLEARNESLKEKLEEVGDFITSRERGHEAAMNKVKKEKEALEKKFKKAERSK